MFQNANDSDTRSVEASITEFQRIDRPSQFLISYKVEGNKISRDSLELLLKPRDLNGVVYVGFNSIARRCPTSSRPFAAIRMTLQGELMINEKDSFEGFLGYFAQDKKYYCKNGSAPSSPILVKLTPKN